MFQSTLGVSGSFQFRSFFETTVIPVGCLLCGPDGRVPPWRTAHTHPRYKLVASQLSSLKWAGSGMEFGGVYALVSCGEAGRGRDCRVNANAHLVGGVTLQCWSCVAKEVAVTPQESAGEAAADWLAELRCFQEELGGVDPRSHHDAQQHRQRGSASGQPTATGGPMLPPDISAHEAANLVEVAPQPPTNASKSQEGRASTDSRDGDAEVQCDTMQHAAVQGASFDQAATGHAKDGAEGPRSDWKGDGLPEATMVHHASTHMSIVMGLSFMTWYKEHMMGTEVLKVQTSCEAFGSHIGTDGDPRASQVATE